MNCQMFGRTLAVSASNSFAYVLRIGPAQFYGAEVGSNRMSLSNQPNNQKHRRFRNESKFLVFVIFSARIF